jgi:CubicO group peptidase (beta-lactamase class C family)
MEVLKAGWSAAARATRSEHDLPSLSVAVARGNDVLWSEASGVADRDLGIPATPDHLFRIASITKLFTATALMILVERGLDLDRPVIDILPEVTSDRVTVRHLLCHGSGLQRETPGDPGWDTGAFYMREDFRRSIPDVWFPFAPMERWKYSNLGYNLLGEIVERVAERPYVDFVTDEVIVPLGLADTVFEPTGEVAARRAQGYVRLPDTDWTRLDEYAWNEFPFAAGALYSTPSDLCRFGAFLIGAVPGPLYPATLELMRRPALLAWPEWEQAHGLGPMILRNGSQTLVGHSGGLYGFAGWLLGDPATGVVACALTNTGDGPPLRTLVMSLAGAAAEIGIEADAPVPPPDDLTRLLGRYLGDASVLMIEWRKGKLVASPEPSGSGPTQRHEIRAAAGGSLVFAEGPYSGEPMTLERDADGAVIGFEVCTYRYRKV